MDELVPFDWASDAHERKCPTCGAEPGQCCSSPDPTDCLLYTSDAADEAYDV